jgi:hypothetical protein
VTPLVTLHLTVIARPRGQRASMASATARMTAARCSRGRSASPISGPKGLKLIGFSVWERRSGGGRNYHQLTYPQPKQDAPKEVPTLETFSPRFIDGYVRANRQKPSSIAAKETIGRVHLVRVLGARRLDAITTESAQQLKHQLNDRSAKTVNNVLTVLNVLLKQAVEWDIIERMPCTIRLLPIPKSSAHFHDFDEYERLVATAKVTDPQAYIVVLLGGV